VTETKEQTRCGFAALIGAPNAGKSTLLNRLVGSKVAIVTHKVQTTRAVLRGVAMRGEAQVIFIDTPGIFDPKRKLDRAMVDAAWSGVGDADLTILLVDAAALARRLEDGKITALADLNDDTARIIEGLSSRSGEKILALNKIDALPRDQLLAMAQLLNSADIFQQVFMISALNGDGVDDLFDHVAAAMPQSPWLYPEDQAADVPLRLLASEITREKIFLRLHQELPYKSTVETEAWTEQKNGDIRIEQTIFVERDSQKKIVLGKGGRTIKDIGSASRKELGVLLERRVHLFLFVKVREGWANDPERYREMGLDFPRD
jgi:GTP-binding protein Era